VGGSDDLPVVMTVEEVCAYLQIHKSTLYRLLIHHQFPGFRVGSDWRFNREQVYEWARLMERTRKPK
jgi:excisionase family DNA binding protein